MSRKPVLEVDNLSVQLSSRGLKLPALKDVSLSIAPGTMMGLVGESGSGKSILCRAVLGLLPTGFEQVAGTVTLDGRQISGLNPKSMRLVRAAEMGFIPQEPMSALNPVLKVGEQLNETIRLTGVTKRRESRDEALRLLRSVGISDPVRCFNSYPHENSGGMRQRILAAIALVGNPRILLADEPTTALDATTQLNFLAMLKELQQTFGCAVLLVTHNMRIVQQICDDVSVMYGGRLVESGRTEQVTGDPQHPYTKALLLAIPTIEGREELTVIPGSPAPLADLGPGCPFAPRCPLHRPICDEEMPPSHIFSNGSLARCWVTQEADIAESEVRG
jgi:oligopeptide/dipeptide ABC transporter ATP-binding protein